MYGIDLVVVDPQTGAPLEGGNVSGVLCVRGAWPGMARTMYGFPQLPSFTCGMVFCALKSGAALATTSDI
jgi:acyl-coenzyme A synthetase/AMP-(fatty) acid ligase